MMHCLPPNAPANTRVSQFWDTNNVWIPLNNGTVQRIGFDDNLHPWRNQYFGAPLQWFQDAALFKFIPITERVTLRFNVDFFNVFNKLNLENPANVIGNVTATTPNALFGQSQAGLAGRVINLQARFSF